MNDSMIHPVVILGSGPAGLTAGIYTARANLHPIIIEGKAPGGQLMGTTMVENWPGNREILGPTLMMNMREHARDLGCTIISEPAIGVDCMRHPFSIATTNETIKAHSLIIATGATPKRLGCPGENEYWGKGVTTCAVCDGAFYKDRPVVIVGGGDTAMEDASFMTRFTDKITIVHIKDKLTASAAMQDRVLDNPKITIIYNSTVSQIIGDGSHVTQVVITNQETGETHDIPVGAVFVAVGLTPNTELFKGQLDLTNYGYIKVKGVQTSIPGIFAAGDVADAIYRQAITSAGTGCMAALDAQRYLEEIKR
ncbi:thioredoxin-disulfide reductase [Candidatus Dependentiae bacterium]|nr:thioredoxin-disulfide reductase [Candidatus Dependentiae bacterium]